MTTPNVKAVVPSPQGPYAPVFDGGTYLFCSGQLPVDPDTGDLVADEVGAQTQQAIENLGSVLRSAGSDLALVVKTTVFLRSLDDFDAMNAVYGRLFAGIRPARSTVGGVALPRGARVEIEAIARPATEIEQAR